MESRYISASEACWRIFHFGMHRQYPSITRLAVHLENEQLCYFNDEDDDNLEDILDKSSCTTLTEWFKTNRENPETRYLKYMNFCDMYVWNKSIKKWTLRQKSNSIGRMYFVSPNAGERYYLRLLLTHVTGATSFKSLRTIDEIEYETYKETCIQYGLLESDDEWDKCLSEAAEMKTGYQLRNLFAMILAQCEVADPFSL